PPTTDSYHLSLHDALPIWGRRFRQGGKGGAGGLAHARAPHARALHRHEARAEALEAGIVLIAGRLVDGALAPELGFERQDRGAVDRKSTRLNSSHVKISYA